METFMVFLVAMGVSILVQGLASYWIDLSHKGYSPFSCCAIIVLISIVIWTALFYGLSERQIIAGTIAWLLSGILTARRIWRETR